MRWRNLVEKVAEAVVTAYEDLLVVGRVVGRTAVGIVVVLGKDRSGLGWAVGDTYMVRWIRGEIWIGFSYVLEL